MTSKEMQGEALRRARNGQATGNILIIRACFRAMGIPDEEIRPRENIYTYSAWQALGRQVRRGQHGVKIATFLEKIDEDTGEVIEKRPWSTTVFHISQTKEL